MPIEALNGIELYYESHGDGPVVTFIHGAGGNHISWWQQIPEFSRHFRCITIDQRGFGRSTDPHNERETRFADDLEALLAHLSIERTALVAQSLGGRTALDFAVRNPDRVTALVMSDTWGFFDWPELQERIVPPPLPSPGAPTTGGSSERYQREHPGGLFLYQQLAALNAGIARASTSQITTYLVAQLPMPTLFLVGTEDRLFPPPIIQAVHQLIPNSEYVELEGCGHSGYWEDPGSFNREVSRFLTSHLRDH